MSYSYCIPARILQISYGLDNMAKGTVDIEGTVLTFTSRKHIVHATNRNYNRCAWKPRAGESVLIDGDINKNALLIDHIECDRQSDNPMIDPNLDKLQAMLPKLATATKTVRHWKPRDQEYGRWRLRWLGEIPRSHDYECVERAGVLHGIWDGFFSEWRLWTTDADTGKRVSDSVPRAGHRLILNSVGGFHKPLPMDVSSSSSVKSTPAPAPAPQVVTAPPYSDCPF